jgi:uracil-DNA glycosylase
LMGRTITISHVRGDIMELQDGNRLLVTIHPSALLRIDDEKDRARQYGKFVADLKICARLLKTVPPGQRVAV